MIAATNNSLNTHVSISTASLRTDLKLRLIPDELNAAQQCTGT